MSLRKVAPAMALSLGLCVSGAGIAFAGGDLSGPHGGHSGYGGYKGGYHPGPHGGPNDRYCPPNVYRYYYEPDYGYRGTYYRPYRKHYYGSYYYPDHAYTYPAYPYYYPYYGHPRGWRYRRARRNYYRHW